MKKLGNKYYKGILYEVYETPSGEYLYKKADEFFRLNQICGKQTKRKINRTHPILTPSRVDKPTLDRSFPSEVETKFSSDLGNNFPTLAVLKALELHNKADDLCKDWLLKALDLEDEDREIALLYYQKSRKERLGLAKRMEALCKNQI